VMLSPLPRNKRAKNPHEGERLSDPNGPDASEDDSDEEGGEPITNGHTPKPPPSGASQKPPKGEKVSTNAAENANFGQNPFAAIEIKTG
jgi:hypothetical protein